MHDLRHLIVGALIIVSLGSAVSAQQAVAPDRMLTVPEFLAIAGSW